MNNHDDLKRLMEAVDPVKVNEPKNGYSNTPGEQYLDSATQRVMDGNKSARSVR